MDKVNSLVFGWTPLAEIIASEGGLDLFQNHWREIALDKDTVPLDVDWRRYYAAEAEGLWRVFAARDGKRIVGYISWYIGPHVRYKSTTYCAADVFYLDPAYRKGTTGYRMIKAALEALPRPCKVLMTEKLHFKEGRVGRLFERLGLRPIEQVYSMTLG